MYVQLENFVEIIEVILKMDICLKDFIVLFVVELDNLNFQVLIDRFNEAGVFFIGGIFLGVIYNSILYKVGVVVKKLQFVSVLVII